MENMKGSSLDDEETMEDLKSRKNIDDDSETSIGNEAPVKLSKPQKEISPRSFEHLEDVSARLADNETDIDVSKSEGEHSTSVFPGLMVEEEVVTCQHALCSLHCSTYHCTYVILTLWIIFTSIVSFSF
jgi:hypothetical protein